MAKLTVAARKKIPTKKFAGPGRSFPIENADHAQAALMDVGSAERAGHVTPVQAKAIRSRAVSFLRKNK